MSVYRKNERLPFEAEDGIWLDFTKNTWIIFIKDVLWDAEEVQYCESGAFQLHFIQKGITDAFLIEIPECIEMSDVPFSIKDADENLIASFRNGDPYRIEIVLVDEKNTVQAVRCFTLNKVNTALLKEKLAARVDENFTSEDADRSYQKIMMRYEPYELEQFSVFKQTK